MSTGTSTETLHVAGSNSRDGVGRKKRPAPHAIDPQVRPATAEALAAFYGKRPQSTIRGFVAYLEDKPVGVIGIVREPTLGKFFCDFKPELEPYISSVKMWRAIKKTMKIVEEYKAPVGAVAEHAEGCRILSRLGFTHIDGDFYAWLN